MDNAHKFGSQPDIMWESVWLITTLILAVKLCQTCFWTTHTFMRASHFFLYFDPSSFKNKQLKHFTAAGNLFASSLFQFWTVINWAKLTRYMSALVQEPEPRGNRSEAYEILTQNRLLQNATFKHYLEWHHCTALSRVWTLIYSLIYF